MEKIRKRLRRHIFWIPFVISFFLSPILINLGTGWLQGYYQNAPRALLWILIYLSLAIVTLLAVYWLATREKPRELTTPDMRPSKMPGLIVLVGTGRKDTTPEELSHHVAIQYHLEANPAQLVCWLIATEGLHGAMDAAVEVAAQYKHKCRDIQIKPVKSGFDVQEMYQLVQSIYQEAEQMYELSADKVIADFTGGTKPMSAGMILACGDQRPMQYVFGGKPEIKATPVLIEFRAAA
jgi:hypothetical protein